MRYALNGYHEGGCAWKEFFEVGVGVVMML